MVAARGGATVAEKVAVKVEATVAEGTEEATAAEGTEEAAVVGTEEAATVEVVMEAEMAVEETEEELAAEETQACQDPQACQCRHSSTPRTPKRRTCRCLRWLKYTYLLHTKSLNKMPLRTASGSTS
jgi:hypothetical protein